MQTQPVEVVPEVQLAVQAPSLHRRDGTRFAPIFYVVFGFCCFSLVVQRALVLHSFGWVFTDLDQVLMWQAAREFSRGRVYEPCFWGQDYNTMIEGLLAVPLVWMGVSPPTAVPLITALLAILPFFLFAASAARRGYWVGAAGCISLPCVISPRFAMVSGLSRGFIPGIVLASLGAVMGLWGRGVGRFTWFGALSCLGISVMPNALPVVAVSGILVGAKSWRNRSAYIYGLFGIAVGSLFPLYSWYFYNRVAPEYLLFPSFKSLTVSWASLTDALLKEALFFDDLLPKAVHGIWGLAICGIGGLGLLVVCRQWVPAAAFAMIPLLCTAMLLNPKVHNASPSLFYSYSRFFLGVPYAVALVLAQVRWSPRSSALRFCIVAGLLVTVGLSLCRLPGDLKQMVAQDEHQANPVGASASRDVIAVSQHLGEFQTTLGVSAWVFNEIHRIAGLGGAALFGAHEFRSFIFNDRRRWFMNQYGRQSFDRIGFYGFPRELRERFLAAGYLLVPGVVDDSLFVVEARGMSLLQLLTEVEPGLISALLANSINGAGGPLRQPQ